MSATIRIKFPDGEKTFPRGTTIAEILSAAGSRTSYPLIAAIIDGRLVNLSHVPTGDAVVEPVDTASSEGMRVYQRSLCFVLVVAFHELYPDVRLVIDHSVPNGGFFCKVTGRSSLTAEELAALETRMREIVLLDEPILCKELSLDEAREVFARQGFQDKVALFDDRPELRVPVCVLRGIHDTFYGLLASRTGILQQFSLTPSDDGFIMLLPQPHMPVELPPVYHRVKIMRVFRDYGRWLTILGLENIRSLNAVVDEGLIREVILVSEALHEKQLSQLADDITRRKGTRIVLVAGPSSSGKTTFARRLAIQLRVNGCKPYALGLDDYFVDRDATPMDEQGQRDYEAFEAINSELLNAQLEELLRGESVTLRRYDFITGRGYFGKPVTLPEEAMLIVEGIHALNPRLLSARIQEQTYSVYVSALTQLNIDDHNRVATTDSRLLRRLVRDAQFRGYPAAKTLERWPSVRRGEEQHIFPYQENADAMFNTALSYELAVLKPFAEPLLQQIPSGTFMAREAARLLELLGWVHPCSAEMVPDNSLLREFIGGSILEDYRFDLPGYNDKT